MSRSRRWTVLGTAALLIGALLQISAAPAPADAAPAHTVATRIVTFVDHHRRTPAIPSAHLPASRSRTLRTTIWYPSDGKGPFPLVVFGHGSNAKRYETLLRAWAEAGYVVAAPDFPVSSKPSPGVSSVGDTINQPGDLSFIIRRVLALDRAKGGLGHVIDRHHIGAAGHSLGAITTLGLAFRSCCRDRLVDAAISLSGTPLLSGTDFRGMHTPLLLVHGNADDTVNYNGSVTSYAKARGPKFFVTVIGGSHDGYLAPDNAAWPTVLRATIDFWDAYLKRDRAALAALERDAVAPGLTSLQSSPA